MSDKQKDLPLVEQEEIQKALETLELLSEQDTLQKSVDTDTAKHNDNPAIADIDSQIATLQAKKEQLSKGVESNINTEGNDDLFKSLRDEFGSRFSSIAQISKSILDSHESLLAKNEELTEQNESLTKSLGDVTKKLDEITKAVNDMANNPINRLGSFSKLRSVERFPEGEKGKETLSLSRDKKQILDRLSKSLESEDGQRRLGSVVGLIENGLIYQENFNEISKSVQNELGGDVNITM